MSASILPVVSPPSGAKKLWIGLWLAVLAVGVYFVVTNVPHYFILSEESYSPYYWPRANYLLPHVLGGLVALAVAWLAISGMALAAIRRRNFVQHKQWMIRSYVVTFAFVTFRILDDVMVYYGIGEDTTARLAMLAWGCWAIPLLVTELVIQGRQVFASR